jgi:hypothetical protein
MNITLPVTQWVPYTTARHVCTFNYGYPAGNAPEVHLLDHRALADDVLWADPNYRASVIWETVASYVEAARVAFNADSVTAAKDDPSLVPLSSVPYLDAAISYTMGARCGLYVLLPNSDYESQTNTGTKTYLRDLYHDEYLDAMVYLRSIRELHRTEYAVEPGLVEATAGTPVFIGRIPKPRSL